MMAKPQPSKLKTEDEQADRQLGIDDLVDDPELRAEMKSLEEAGIQDFLAWEESLDDED
jgi:hypothetical protein